MASTDPVSTTSFASFAESTAKPANSSSSSTTGGVSKEMFLQLLVAQIKNQDPLNPADGTEFVSELAQFSNLEQVIAIRQDADSLVSFLGVTPDSEDTGSTSSAS